MFRGVDMPVRVPTRYPGVVLPQPIAPLCFRGIVASGKNPEGKYWKEYDGSGTRFNLFERACERVPASRGWLLKEFLPYCQEDPPHLAHSRMHLLSFLSERNLMFLPRRAASSLNHLHPWRYRYLEKRAVRELPDAATPSPLLFLMDFLHEVAWRRIGCAVDGA